MLITKNNSVHFSSPQAKSGCLFLMACFFLFSTHVHSEVMPHNTEQATKQTRSQCLSCHKALPQTTFKNNGQYLIPNMKHFLSDSNDMCEKCHGDDKNSHIVGMEPDYPVPADLPLDTNNEVSCLTCHYFHGSLKSDVVMASTSVMDRIFNRTRLKKSFLLRRNNSKGDLCLACHQK